MSLITKEQQRVVVDENLADDLLEALASIKNPTPEDVAEMESFLVGLKDEMPVVNEDELDQGERTQYNEIKKIITALEQFIYRISDKPAVQKPPKAPKAPDPSNGGDTMKTSTTPLTHFWGQALSAGGQNPERWLNGWIDNTVNQHPKFARTNMTHGGGEAVVYFDPKGYSALELWGKVYSIDDVVLEVYTVILALMCDSRNACPPGYVKRFYINPSQVLNLSGFRRWGEDRRVALRRVIDAIKLLSEWTTDYGGFPLPPDKKGKPRFAEKRGCKIFHVLSSWHSGEQGELFEKENGDLEHAPLSIHCVSGEWLEHWMNSEDNYFWVQSISRKLLEIPGVSDAERYAKRIGMLLLGFVAGTAHINEVVRWEVQKILEDLVLMPTDEFRGLGGREARKNEHWANRTDKALFGYYGDKVDAEGNELWIPGAFDILLEYGVLARYWKGDDDNPYPDPGCRGAGWVERWLKVPVFMVTPEAAAKITTNPLPDSLTQDPVLPAEKPAIDGKVVRKWTRRGTGKPKKKLALGQYLDTATAESLRVEISRQFPNQEKAAAFLGCTQSGLSRVLSRNRAPGVELAAKIKAFLDNPEG